MASKVKVIHTSDGDKLKNTKTGKLAGSVPKKPKPPKPSRIVKNQEEADFDQPSNLYENLASKQKWFHSTPAELPVGTVLKTGESLGINNFLGDDKANNKKVWIEPKAHLALGWGSQASRINGKQVTHIYQVQPNTAPIKKGNKGWVAESALVVSLFATLPAIAYSLESSEEAVEQYLLENKDKIEVSRKSKPLFDSEYISYFTQEYCDQLALELNKRKGWSLFACTEKWIKEEAYEHDDRCYGEGVIHIVVGLPDGKFLDINGIQSEEEVAEKWPGTFLRETKGCCFKTWVHPRKVSESKVKLATEKLLALVEECL